MKKQLMILATAVALTGSAFGQGQVTLANNATSLVTVLATGAPVAIGSTTFQLYVGANAGSLTPLLPTAGVNTAAAGRIANTIYNITAVAPGATATFQIWAWASNFASYAAAESGNGNVGKSVVFTQTTSPDLSPNPQPTPTSLAGRYAGFTVAPVPEPSTIALGILGAGSLLFMRRKK